MSNRRPVVLFTVDVDGWPSHVKYYLKGVDVNEAYKQVPLKQGILRLLELFAKFEMKATFFVPGDIARRFPDLVLKISNERHEIACHGLTHEKDEFLTDYKRQEKSISTATEILEGITGTRPIGFRAPAFRYNSTTIELLLKYGYRYDSSSIKTWGLGLYGRLSNKRIPSKIPGASNDSKCLRVFPIATTPVVPIPLGGAWLRIISHHFIKSTLNYYERLRAPLVFYIHPRDVSPLPRIKGIPWYTYKNSDTPMLTILNRLIGYCKSRDANIIPMKEAIGFLKEE